MIDLSHVITHYDTLGVARDASDAELRSAYRALARQLHPDLRGDRTPTQRVDDERAMQQLNAAWHVLSDPARRRRYDQSLNAGSADDCPVEPATDDPPEYVSEPTGRGRGLPAVALLSVVLVSAVLGAFVLFHETSSPPGHMEALTVGTCVTVRGGHISEVVPCDSPNDGRILAESRVVGIG